MLKDGVEALNLLVIDDNPQMREIMTTILRGAGLTQLLAAANGRRGLDLVVETRPDIIYVDYEMPMMNGLDFVSHVRRLGGDLQFIPIIMLTGHSDMRRLTAARDRGVNEFVAKPVTVKTVLERLQYVILNPRPFARSSTYFGPERRRRRNAAYAGPRRRAADVAQEI